MNLPQGYYIQENDDAFTEFVTRYSPNLTNVLALSKE